MKEERDTIDIDLKYMRIRGSGRFGICAVISIALLAALVSTIGFSAHVSLAP